MLQKFDTFCASDKAPFFVFGMLNAILKREEREKRKKILKLIPFFVRTMPKL